MSRARDLNMARRLGRELAPCPYRQRHLRAAWSRAYEAHRVTFASKDMDNLRAALAEMMDAERPIVLPLDVTFDLVPRPRSEAQRARQIGNVFAAGIAAGIASVFDSQSNFEEWEALERARLGYYPGHDDACPMRERESLLTSSCACGPKEGDA